MFIEYIISGTVYLTQILKYLKNSKSKKKPLEHSETSSPPYSPRFRRPNWTSIRHRFGSASREPPSWCETDDGGREGGTQPYKGAVRAGDIADMCFTNSRAFVVEFETPRGERRWKLRSDGDNFGCLHWWTIMSLDLPEWRRRKVAATRSCLLLWKKSGDDGCCGVGKVQFARWYVGRS